MSLENYRAAIEDLDRVISLMNPAENQLVANDFYYRGLAKSLIVDKQAAVADYQKAIELNSEHGNAREMENYILENS